jgi:predicted HTH transcriptional regulator
MITEKEFESLLIRTENETLDFKATEYDLTNEGNRYSLVKDAICMANTPRESSSYIVLGVKKYLNGSYELRGIDKIYDEADIQSQFAERFYPIPNITYYLITYHNKQFGIIEIFPSRIGPCVPLKDLEISFGNGRYISEEAQKMMLLHLKMLLESLLGLAREYR